MSISVYDCLGKEHSYGEYCTALALANHIPEEHEKAFKVIFDKVNKMPEFKEATQLDKMCIAFKNCGNEDIISTNKSEAGALFKKMLFEDADFATLCKFPDILDSQSFYRDMSAAYSKALRDGTLTYDTTHGAQNLDAYLARCGALGRSMSGSMDAKVHSALLLNILPEETVGQIFMDNIDHARLTEAIALSPERFKLNMHMDIHENDVIMYRRPLDYRGVDKLAGLAYALSEEEQKFLSHTADRPNLEKYRDLKATLSEEMYAIDQECDDMKFSKVRRVGSKLIGTVEVDGRKERFMYDIPNHKLGFWDESLSEKNALAIILTRIKRAIEHYLLGGFLQPEKHIHNLGSVTVNDSTLDRLIRQAEETDPNPYETRQRFQKEFGEPDDRDNPWDRDDWDER